jgi:Putative  PD-(D/E)XK family member, (DUF4420)
VPSGLRALLEDIRREANEEHPGHFVAKPIPGFERHFVAWNHLNFPCVLLETSDAYFRAPLQLTGLEVVYCSPCDVTLSNGVRTNHTLSVITCTSAEQNTQDYFLHLMETLLRIIGVSPRLSAVADAVAKLVEILQQLTHPNRRSVIGLYAELTVIALSANPAIAVAAWRAALDDRFDFALADARLETKATSDRMRAHHFSFEQCNPPVGVTAAIASMFVEPNGGGQSLAELIAEVELLLRSDDQARLKLQNVVASSLGSSLLRALEMRFDEHLSRTTLLFFDALDIPAIRSDIPSGVSHIHFRGDLTGLVPRSLGELRARNASLRRLLPSTVG